jgi:hypothetical protein
MQHYKATPTVSSERTKEAEEKVTTKKNSLEEEGG